MSSRRAIEILRYTERITEEAARVSDVVVDDKAVEVLAVMLIAAPPAPGWRTQGRGHPQSGEQGREEVAS